MSGEDDELFCKASYPPLSAVDCGSERIGYEAATLLALHGGKGCAENIASDRPVGRAGRHSTDVLAMEDRQLAEALAYLRKNAYGPLHVRDLLEQVPLSRRALEQRFRRILGCSPAAELRAAAHRPGQGTAGRHELADAEDCGRSRLFASRDHEPVFRRELDQTPTQYRRAALRAKGH